MKNKAVCLFNVLTLAATYFIVGKLSLALAIPPGFASPVWPAAGFALAAVLICGYRLGIGVFLGSFLLNLFVAGGNSFSVDSITPLITGGGIALGATLQAVFSAHLIKRFNIFPTTLEKERDIFGLLLWGAPVGCLMNAIIGPLTLFIAGVIPADSFMVSAFTWWVGDAIGVILFTPLLILFAVKDVPVIRKIVVSIPIALFIALAVFVFFDSKDEQRAEEQQKFDAIAQNISSEFEKNMQTYLNVLIANERFIHASDHVSYEEFEAFASKFFEIHPGIQALTWTEKVTDENRAAFEKSLQEQGFPTFVIKDRVQIGNIRPAGRREIYFPVTYIIPYEQNRAAHGYDTYGPDEVSDNVRQQVLDKARDEGRALTTGRISIVQAENQYGLLIYNPVYSKALKDDSPDGRRRHLLGYTAGVFIISDMMNPINQFAQQRGADIVLRDLSAQNDRRLLFDSRTPNHREPEHPIDIPENALISSETLDIAGHVWEIEFIQKPEAVIKNHGWRLWYILTGGLLFSGIFGAFILVVSIQTSRGTAATELRRPGFRIYAIPVLSACMTLALTGLLYTQLAAQERQTLLEIVHEENALVRRIIEDNLKNAVFGLKRMAQRWEAAGGTPQDLWRKDASNYVLNFDALTTIEWADSNYTIRWVEPLAGNEAALGLNIAFDEERKNALKGAAQKNTITLTPPLDLVQGYRAVISYIPLHINDEFNGFLIGIYDIDAFLHSVLPDEFEELFNLRLTDNNALLYASAGAEEVPHDLHVDSHSDIFAHDWTVTVWPNQKFFDNHRSLLPHMILSGGGLLSLLVGFSIFYALTARRQSQLLYKQTHELEEAKSVAERANTMKSEFLANMSHELRTPLNGVIGAADLLQSLKLNKTQRNYVEIISASGSRLLNLINDILDLSKIEAGEHDIKPRNVALKTLVDKTVHLMTPQIVQKKLDMTIRYDPDIPEVVFLDDLAVEQILTNLLSNAVKFTDTGGVLLSIDMIESPHTSPRLHFAVADNGIGIPPDKVDDVFDKFSQLDSSSTKKHKGTGLGLAISKHLVALMDGDIGVRSTPGEGAVFWFEIDLIQPGQETDTLKNAAPATERAKKTDITDEPKPASNTETKHHILLVEDEVVNQIIAKNMLEEMGCTVDLAENGQEAVDMTIEKSYDIVFMDCSMPVMDGYEATKRIRRNETTGGGRQFIVAMTANALEYDKDKCIKAGMDDYMAKPIRKQRLKDKLQEWLVAKQT